VIMNVASIFRAISASFIDGKSVNFCVVEDEPLSLCCVIQLVTGQVRWHVTEEPDGEVLAHFPGRGRRAAGRRRCIPSSCR